MEAVAKVGSDAGGSVADVSLKFIHAVISLLFQARITRARCIIGRE